MARILDGAAFAAAIKQEVAAEVGQLAARGIRPGLAAVLVGHVAASEIYVRNKVQACAEVGLYSDLITPPADVSTEDLLALVDELNARDDIDGILIQLPLPPHVDSKRLLEAINPAKDVDGFHPVNAGRLLAGRPSLVPCTPAGVIEILKRSQIPIAGQHAVVAVEPDHALLHSGGRGREAVAEGLPFTDDASVMEHYAKLRPKLVSISSRKARPWARRPTRTRQLCVRCRR